jgi:hypothetical protein
MGIYTLLHQDKVWIDREEVEHRIADMEPRYCANVVRFLQRQHDRLGSAALFEMTFMAMPNMDTAAFDSLDRATEAVQDEILGDSLKWLNETPLMVALAKRAAEVA